MKTRKFLRCLFLTATAAGLATAEVLDVTEPAHPQRLSDKAAPDKNVSVQEFPSVNDAAISHYQDTLIVSTSTKLVSISVPVAQRTTDNIHYDAHSERVSFYKSPSGPEIVTCTFTTTPQRITSDCGLEPLLIGGCSDCPPSYLFVLKDQRPGWIRFFSDSKLSRTLWIDEKSNPNVNVIALPDWMISEAGLKSVERSMKDKIQILESPREGSKILGTCHETALRAEGLDTSGIVHAHVVQEDWIEAFCETPDCFSDQSPNYSCISVDERRQILEERRSKFGACIHGWVQWRTPSGKLLLYPMPTYSGC